MNRLSLDRRTQAINFLVEGNSIGATEWMTGIHRYTIMRLLVEVGLRPRWRLACPIGNGRLRTWWR